MFRASLSFPFSSLSFGVISLVQPKSLLWIPLNSSVDTSVKTSWEVLNSTYFCLDFNLENGSDMCVPKCQHGTTILLCLKSPKSADSFRSRWSLGIILSVTCPPRLPWKSQRPTETVDRSATTRSDLTVLLKFRAIPWLRRLVAGLSPYRPGVTTKPVHMVFAVDRVAFGQVSLPVPQFFFVTAMPSLLRISNSFSNHRRRTTSVIDSVIT
jgi:hypothetical protein